MEIKKEQAIKQLGEFNKFAEDLFGLSFVKKLRNSGFKISWKSGKGFRTDWRGPDEESIKAFVNDIRKFFQKNDTLKIHKLIPTYQSKLVDESEKKIFNKAMSNLDFFNKSCTFVEVNNEKITNEKVLEVFLYGKYSHRTKKIKDIHDDWEKNVFIYTPLKSEFIRVLKTYLIIVNNIVHVNREVLKKLK